MPRLYHVGCAGRITQFAETGDGRYLSPSIGIARFRILEELGDHDALPAVPRRISTPSRPISSARAGRGRGRPRRRRQGPAGLRAGGRRAGRLAGHRGGAERGAGQCPVHDEPVRRARETGASGGARPQDPRRGSDRPHGDRAGARAAAARTRRCNRDRDDEQPIPHLDPARRGDPDRPEAARNARLPADEGTRSITIPAARN